MISKRQVKRKLGYVVQFDVNLACVANVSVRFRSKERGTRFKDGAKNGASTRAGTKPRIPRGQNRKSPSSVFLCYETERKRLLRRLT